MPARTPTPAAPASSRPRSRQGPRSPRRGRPSPLRCALLAPRPSRFRWSRSRRPSGLPGYGGKKRSWSKSRPADEEDATAAVATSPQTEKQPTAAEAKDPKDLKEAKDTKDTKEVKAAKDSKEMKAAKEPRARQGDSDAPLPPSSLD
jgi:hypothetical protein